MDIDPYQEPEELARMMEGKDSVCGLPAETSPEIEKSITMIEAQNKSVDPGQQFQRKQVQSMYEEVKLIVFTF